jgi:chemotaxis protein MotC
VKWRIAFVALALFVTSDASWGQNNLQLAQSIGVLSMLQDATAQGDEEAEGRQARLIAQIETDILNGPRLLEADRKTISALTSFVLSGGNPNIVEKHLLLADENEPHFHVLRAALSYVRANRANALKEVERLDAMELPATIGGRMALMRAILRASSDMPKALDDLDLARRLMPGTLLEEAALRRCIAFSGDNNDRSRFENCGQRYMRRFPKSLYWKDFADGFVKSAVKLSEVKLDAASLRHMTQGLPPAKTRDLALGVAQQAISKGAFDLALSVSVWASELALAGSVELHRARLYRIAALIADPGGSKELQSIEGLDEARLPAVDGALLAKLRDIRNVIEREPQISYADALQLVSPPERESLSVDVP